jgi:hypothetical protein
MNNENMESVSYLLRDVLERLSEIPIEWDRCTDSSLFGWIKRTDGKRDFIIILYEKELEDDMFWSFTTSSSKYCARIHELIFDDDEDFEHVPCTRVDISRYIAGSDLEHSRDHG